MLYLKQDGRIMKREGGHTMETTHWPAQSLAYVRSELNRIQTIAGTLSSIEQQHSQDLTDMGDDRLNQIAVEEQSAARQLGQIKQICLALLQQLDEVAGHSTTTAEPR
jgi:hypothetical protein